ncbi:hypothetical protein FHX49_000989 [Microbacterium endophyticum]|uniref:Uncharacterized protein n=1 Tax=Microbacterium endophyticum TaxID=1526412 RepID=A0A7W4V3F0_9MICO|nr:hypothetical protein [Microbacterium endophyticum]MBB2975423.1 hypothetical protein [Microbacterium endophyticum]NIK35558.1 hypothetical protein [Microbacterium endophyticum]
MTRPNGAENSANNGAENGLEAGVDDTVVSARKTSPSVDADAGLDDDTVVAARRVAAGVRHDTDDETFIASRKSRVDDDDTFIAERGDKNRSAPSTPAEPVVSPETRSAASREIYRPRAANPAMVTRAAPAPARPQAPASGTSALRQAQRGARWRAVAVVVGASILIVAVIVLTVALVV